MKVLIVDDHVVVREGVRRLLALMPDMSVSEASAGREALMLFRAERPDLVVLDLNLKDWSGLELLRRLLIEDKAVRVLVLSMHAESIYAGRALRAGARGYVSKNAAADEMVTAIRQVAAGGRYVEREIADELAVTQYSVDDPLQQLTTREVDILRLLGEGKSLAAIAQTLGVTYKTIANSCSLIKGKLGVERTADLIRLTFELREPIEPISRPDAAPSL
jgi:two-component system, NarL family, invasion response regulator UvrY